jgi:DNA-binding NarL/FixJ family response regulator
MKKTRILLADDHAIVRAGIKKVLKKHPDLEIVAEVGDGPALIQSLTEFKPDCLLADVTMPDFEPISEIKRIRNQYPDMRILIISAYDDDIYVKGLFKAGVDGYYLKGQSLQDLHLALDRILEGEKWVSSPLVDKLISNSGNDFSAELTNRQLEIFKLLQDGFDNQSIARELGLSIKTIENHLTRIYRKLNVQSRMEAVNIVKKNPGLLKSIPQQSPLKNERTDAVSTCTYNILVIDDNSRYRKQLKNMILKVCPNAILYETNNIDESIRITEGYYPELIFIDVILGDESGISCTQRLHKLAPESRIILISAYPDQAFHRKGLDAGAIAFIDKKALDVPTIRHMIDDLQPN